MEVNLVKTEPAHQLDPAVRRLLGERAEIEEIRAAVPLAVERPRPADRRIVRVAVVRQFRRGRDRLLHGIAEAVHRCRHQRNRRARNAEALVRRRMQPLVRSRDFSHVRLQIPRQQARRKRLIERARERQRHIEQRQFVRVANRFDRQRQVMRESLDAQHRLDARIAKDHAQRAIVQRRGTRWVGSAALLHAAKRRQTFRREPVHIAGLVQKRHIPPSGRSPSAENPYRAHTPAAPSTAWLPGNTIPINAHLRYIAVPPMFPLR